MESIAPHVPQVRDSVCAILRIIKETKHRGKKQPPLVHFKLGFAGTAWCIVANRYLVTAHHIFNGLGKQRDAADSFYAFTVPGNGPDAYEFPVIGFPVEDPSVDLAVIEIGASSTPGQQISPVAVTFARPPDGAPVLTYGFPAAVVGKADVAPDGKYLGGHFFLKGHANEGIVAGQYDGGKGTWHFEFNIGWHHGESGGPVVQLEPLAVFAVMQHYRNIQTPHGVHPGPHIGRSLNAIKDQLTNLGAVII